MPKSATPVKTRCPKCGGLGKHWVYLMSVACNYCKGTGKSYEFPANIKTPAEQFNNDDDNED